MEKRVLIAIVLSIAVMYGYSLLFPQPKQTPIEKVNVAAGQQAETVGKAAVPAQVVATTPTVQGSARDVVVETEVLRAVLSSQGGALKELVLKKYTDKAGSGGKAIVLLKEQQPELYSFTSDFPGFPSAAGALFSTSDNDLQVKGDAQKTVEFTFTAANGLQLKKKYTFTATGYNIAFDNQLGNNSSATIDGALQTRLRSRSVKPADDAGRYEIFGPATLAETGVSFDALTDLAKGEKTYQKGVKWTGFADKYFLRAIMTTANSLGTVTLRDAAGICEQTVTSEKISLAPGQQNRLSYKLYLGPKDIDILKAQGEKLEAAIDLGWFSAIAMPLLQSLKLFYRYLHNYGLAIILITVILKILFFPLTHKSYKSMKEMQKLQPQMQTLKEKFKDDRDGLNRAVMELYKAHKVNPLGGCLPMIVQIPVFFGLYKALMFSIELRHAPFYFWLQDLAAKDPYYVTPIIMGATMFIQQKMTPTNMDPVQAKMMLALPVVFTAMFLNFPSGLVLYWLVNNILTIAQQAYINKSLKES